MTGIPAFAGKRAGGYSTGMRQRLALAQALLGTRACWSSTSPPTAWTPRASGGFAAFFATCATDQGKTVLVSSHLLQEVEQTVDDIVIISNGMPGQAGRDGRPRRRGGALVVRTSDPARARASPRRGRDHLRPGEDGSLLVRCRPTCTLIGDVSLAAGCRSGSSAQARGRPRSSSSSS